MIDNDTLFIAVQEEMYGKKRNNNGRRNMLEIGKENRFMNIRKFRQSNNLQSAGSMNPLQHAA
jgi:hypothetical protein